MPLSLDATAKALLFPLLLAQGALARRRATALPEPDGPRHGEAGHGPALRLLLLGDSSAAGVGAPDQASALSGQLVAALQGSYRLTWRLEATSGATTATTIAALKQVPAGQFDLAVVALGVNDITGGVTQRRLLARRSVLYSLLRQRFAVRRIVVSGLPPMKNFPLLAQPLRWVLGRQSERFDRALARHAAAEGAEYVPFAITFDARLMAPDGFHPAPGAYRLWASLLARAIAQ